VDTGPRHVIPAAALAVAMLGAVAITVSPLTPWVLGVAACGTAAVTCGAAVVVVGLFHRWW
jgi:hypothetical protein